MHRGDDPDRCPCCDSAFFVALAPTRNDDDGARVQCRLCGSSWRDVPAQASDGWSPVRWLWRLVGERRRPAISLGDYLAGRSAP